MVVELLQFDCVSSDVDSEVASIDRQCRGSNGRSTIVEA